MHLSQLKARAIPLTAHEKLSQIKQNSLLLEMLSTFEENLTKSNQDVHKAGYEHEISIKK
jgi:hypothetical protein